MNQEEIKVEKFVYKGDWSPENLNSVREILDPLSWFIPGWVIECSVWWVSTSNYAIQSSIEYDYRRAHLNFAAQFIESGLAERRYMILHDMLHGFTSVPFDYAKDTIEELLPKDESPKFREHITKELRTRNESATQDLAHALMRVIYPAT